jgi:anti-repressor protein
MLSVFEYENSPVRFVDDKPVANDVAFVLGYADPAKTISTKVKTKYRSVTKMVTVDGKLRDVIVLEEAGIYQLVFGSKLDSAEKFQEWVFEQVLPSIRKTGGYSVHCDYEQMSIEELKASLTRKQLILEHIKLDRKMKEYKPMIKEESTIDNIKLQKIYRMLTKKSSLTTTTIKDSIREFRTTPSSQINDLMLSLVEMERADVMPTRKGLRIKLV